MGELGEDEGLELGGIKWGMNFLDGVGEEGDVVLMEELVFEGEGLFFFMHELVPFEFLLILF